MPRIQVIVDEQEREAFRAQASTEGRSLSEWLREAGRDKLTAARPARLSSREQLEDFFRSCDERESGRGREPDWAEHRAVIDTSRRSGIDQP